MDVHMHFDLYDDRNEILSYVKQKASYTIAVTNLPQLFEKYKRQYVENKYFQLALGFRPELVHQYSNQQMLFKELINETRFIVVFWKNKILSIHSRYV